LATAGLICPTPVCEYTWGIVVVVAGSVVGVSVVEVVEVASAVVEGVDVACTLVVVAEGPCCQTGATLDVVGSLVTAGVACEVELHATVTIVSTLSDNTAKMRH